jgi:hypothetical protein
MINKTVMPHHQQTASTVDRAAETSPFVVEFFMVQGLGFRGMAYCDEEGIWRNAFNNDQLLGRIYLVE